MSQKPNLIIVLLYINKKKESCFYFFTDGKQHKACKVDMMTLRSLLLIKIMHRNCHTTCMIWLPVTRVSLTWLLYNLQLQPWSQMLEKNCPFPPLQCWGENLSQLMAMVSNIEWGCRGNFQDNMSMVVWAWDLSYNPFRWTVTWRTRTPGT